MREQEQSANIQQRAVAKEEPRVREQRQEQEQPANTRQQAVAREEPGVLWLQREYGLHVQVEYTLYEDYLVAQNQHQNIYPKYTARLSDLQKVLCIMARGTYLKVQNLNTVVSLIFVGQ